MPSDNYTTDLDELRRLLAAYDGTGARDLIMNDRRDAGRINYLFTQAHKWLIGWFRSRDINAVTADGDDFSEAALWNFVHALYPERRPVDWNVADLPRLLDALRSHGVTLHKQRFPSREVNE